MSRLALRTRWLVYAVDEVDSFCNAGSLSSMDPRAFLALFPGSDPEADAALYQIANYSRNQFHIAFVFTSRYPAQVARGLTSQCSELRTFLITEPNHLEYLRAYYGADTERLSALGRFYYLVYRDGSPVQLAGGEDHRGRRF